MEIAGERMGKFVCNEREPFHNILVPTITDTSPITAPPESGQSILSLSYLFEITFCPGQRSECPFSVFSFISLWLYLHIGPAVDIFPEDTYAIEGEGILFPVSVRGHPKPTITWFFEGHEMTKEHSVEVQQDGSIFISLVQLKHTGHYKLLAKNTIGSIERSFNLFVKLRELRRILTMHNGTILKPVPLDAFGAYVAENHAEDNKGFKSQYTVCVKVDPLL